MIVSTNSSSHRQALRGALGGNLTKATCAMLFATSLGKVAAAMQPVLFKKCFQRPRLYYTVYINVQVKNAVKA